MKLCISIIHTGRYKIESLDDNNQVVAGFDGGSALVMMMITKYIFEPENAQYSRDERTSSDALTDETLTRFAKDPILSPNSRARAHIEVAQGEHRKLADQRPRRVGEDLNPRVDPSKG